MSTAGPPPVLRCCHRSSEAVLGGTAFGRNFMQHSYSALKDLGDAEWVDKKDEQWLTR